MAEPESALEHLDYQTPIPCYYLDPADDHIESFSCDEAAHLLVTWRCFQGHQLEQPYCLGHAQHRPDQEYACLSCKACTAPSYARPIPPDYWPGGEA